MTVAFPDDELKVELHFKNGVKIPFSRWNDLVFVDKLNDSAPEIF